MRKGEESRQRIIRCAAELFWSRGYHTTGMNDILSLAGLPRGSFYFHFGSKKELASAVISHYDSVLLDKFRDLAVGRAWPEFIDGVFGLLKGRADSGTFRGCPFAVMGMELAVSEPELAAQYATRIVNLKDGVIRSDSMPYTPEAAAPAVHKNLGKSSMSIFTSLALSFNNLRTKKARTFLTAFAGSIGIIGIALILSLSNGVNNYIASIEKDTLSEYPLQIQSTGVDFSSFMTMDSGQQDTQTEDGRVSVARMLSSMFSRQPSYTKLYTFSSGFFAL